MTSKSRFLLQIPAALDLPAALSLSLELGGSEGAEEFVFDFSNVRMVEPFAMLLVSSEISRLKRRFPNVQLRCANFQHMGYAAHMGFFRAFGLSFGNAPGEAKGGSRYVPLTIFDCNSLRREAAQKGIEVGNEIEENSRKLASTLCNGENGALFETLSYSIRELMRNVVEHSDAERFGICAQYWPTKNRAEVGILDRGIGLRESLKNNPHIDASDDKRAINYALMPAVSGKAFKGARNKQRGPWANSGFGLYMTSRICRNGGTFFIATGESGLLLTQKSEGKRYYDCRFQGTAVRMVMRTDQVRDLRETLSKYRSEGFEIQSRYREIVNIDPSSASLMLAEDFDLSVWDRILAKVKAAI
ncbi:hypothetical protein [Burkholderia sp. BCC1988]|uniref:hypothetical protein n=1 Tax=Burkholderia sp. BCC1988 TaxID=2817443 RepID=UPI002AAF94EB|nr:hypothetical protein [Burkholderia sp. BCC1988]